MRRSVEQTAVFESPSAGYTAGVVRGFDRSVARTGVGLFEVVTFPFPCRTGYEPMFTKYLPPGPVYPGKLQAGPDVQTRLFDTDTYIGFSGGDVAPLVPGSRFKIFDN